MEEDTRGDTQTAAPATELENRFIGEDIEKVGKETLVEDLDTVREEGEGRMVSVTFGAEKDFLDIVFSQGELTGEEVAGEQITEDDEKIDEQPYVIVEEEEQYIKPPPPDPNAPYDLSDSNEALKAPFQLRLDQQAEVEQLWEVYQDYTPAFTEIDNFITE